MPLARYNPFHELETLQRRMNHLFDESILPHWDWKEDSLSFTPAAELSETDEAVLLKLEVPGMQAEDLDIQVSKDTVSITGERKVENRSEDNGVTRSEFRYGKFQRIISLPALVKNTDVKAEYKDGILHLTLPKAEEEKNKVVKVNIG
jgi:HSP20 family protein